MPNHVTNIIEIKGDPARVKALFESVKNDEFGLGSIDFNKLIPMPPELDMEEGNRTTRGLKAYKDKSSSLSLSWKCMPVYSYPAKSSVRRVINSRYSVPKCPSK